MQGFHQLISPTGELHFSKAALTCHSELNNSSESSEDAVERHSPVPLL